MKNFKFESRKIKKLFLNDQIITYNFINKHYKVSIDILDIRTYKQEFIVKLINLKTKNCKKYYINNIYNTLPNKYNCIIDEVLILESF